MPNTRPAPQWLAADQMLHVEPREREWLFNEDSLTRRLTALAEGEFSVLPLKEGWQTLRSDECEELGLPHASCGWAREVLLRGHGEGWVYARSVAGESALRADGFDLASLGTRSLGELLFSDRAFSRGELKAAGYPPAWLPFPNDATLWARRSVFRRNALGVLVMEVFLPAFWAAEAASSR
ncbi:chorismate--pyruvate lyase family protein [Pseudomonas matsuisoli]|uniref:Probable chorismate pyruvate-lyase n=1 Tax=Pseudomonas matsuisoli TaxID=1515666 RepID=A0A917UXV2_9PSED|nr:chorismate lyase [Pseudomonas matsuisoli]GGJ94233.1 putative chorismate pyruvate-lyase [Pseudomonas matsuisoli]